MITCRPVIVLALVMTIASGMGALAQPAVPDNAPAQTLNVQDAPAPILDEPQPAGPVSSEIEPMTLAPAVDPGAGEDAVEVPTGFGHDLSPWGMFMAADWVVKGVMVGLAFAAFLTCVIWVAKSLELAGANVRARRMLKAVSGMASLNEALSSLEGKRGVGMLLLKAAEEEVRLSLAAIDTAGGDGLKERLSARLSRLVGAAGQRIARGTGIIATIGSTAPFIGLFGTVWGIMNAFIGISEAQTTNLAVVAPGIAEALLATAIGLVAAIPAVIVYNVFARAITAYRRLLGDTASAIERLVSRDIDYRTLSLARPADGSRVAAFDLRQTEGAR